MNEANKRDKRSLRSKSFNFLHDLQLFQDLSDEEMSCFSDAALFKSYKKGEHLYIEGEEAKFFYVVCSGWLKLMRVTQDGEEIVLGMLTKNNITGEGAIFEDGFFTCSAQIAEDAQILSIPIAVLKQQMSISTRFAMNMLASMIQYQRLREMQLEQFLLYNAPQRVGCFILGLCPSEEQVDGVQIDLPYDKALIAGTLAMTGSTFSRALNVLHDEAGISIEGSRVTITSIKRLLKFVNGCYLMQLLHEEKA